MDRQNHLISLVAVFLALGIGILIGASMGVNALVLNQISVIEELQNEIDCFKEETVQYNALINKLKQDINSWEVMENDYFNPFFIKNKLNKYTVKVICQENFPQEIKNFLELTGCRYRIFLFAQDINWDEISLQTNNLFPSNKDLDILIADFLIDTTVLNGEKNSLQVFLEEENILALYENNWKEENEEKEELYEELVFLSGITDPFLLKIVDNLSRKQNFVFFLSSDEEELNEDVLEISGQSCQNRQLCIGKFSGKIKLLELIQKMTNPEPE